MMREKTQVIVRNIGIRIGKTLYRSDALVDYMGCKVLVSVPHEGKISVFSLEGVYLTEATIVETR